MLQIVETMPYSADVATFIEVLGPFYEYVAEDLNILDKDDIVINPKSHEEENPDSTISDALGKYDLNSGMWPW